MTTDQITETQVDDDGFDPSSSAEWETPPNDLGVADAPPATEPAPAPEDGGGSDAPAPGPASEPTAPEAEAPPLLSLPDELRQPAPEPQQGISEADRQELEQLRRERQETLHIQNQNRQATAIQEAAQRYMSLYNLDEATARFVATEREAARQEGEAAVAQERMRAQIEVGRRNAAQAIGREMGVDPSALMDLDSPEAMRREAKWIVYTAKNDRRVARVERAQVPDQQFAGAGQGEAVTPDNIDALWLAGRISDERYDAFLRQNEEGA